MKHRFSKGFTLKGNYTWSHNLDDGTGTTGENANQPNAVDPWNLRLDYGPAATDFRHQASISGSYELPIGKGKPWLGNVSGVADKLASGWQLNSILSLVSGYPLNVTAGSNISGSGDANSADRPNFNPAFTGPIVTGNPNQWFNPNAFVVPQSGTYGDEGKGALRGPGVADLDLSLFKSVALTERLKLQFRAEVFNIVNHPNFGLVVSNAFSSGVINPTAGAITATSTTSRQIQFSMKVIF